MNTKENMDNKVEKIKNKILGSLLISQDLNSEESRKEMAGDLSLSQETLDLLAGEMLMYRRDKQNFKIMQQMYKNTETGVSIYKDVSAAMERVKNSERSLFATLDQAKFESYVTKLQPEQTTIEVIEYLKGNGIDGGMRQKAIEKYAAGLSVDKIEDDSVFCYLYENNYHAENNNPQLDLAYKYYCDSRKRDENIKNLQNQIDEKDDIIDGMQNKNRMLNLTLNYYKNAVPKLQNKIEKCTKNARRNIFFIKEIKKQAEQREGEGLFGKFRRRIAGFLKREKPLLLSVSLSELQKEMGDLTSGLVDVENLVPEPSTQENMLGNLQIQKQKNYGVMDVLEPASR